MSSPRSIKLVLSSKPVLEGAGVRLNRVFGFGGEDIFDPFLLLDDFRSDKPAEYLKGFPWHPHRGIETITYVLKGDVEHGDSLGNQGLISSGDVQWMTAGSGIIHQEMPKGDEAGSMHGFQLWANLPAREKMIEPRYRDITADRIPEVRRDDGIRVKVIAGRFDTTNGPVDDILIEPTYLDCFVPSGGLFRHDPAADHTVLVYLTAGSAVSGSTRAVNGAMIVYGPGDYIEIAADHEPARFLLLSGKPLREPVAWRGPIVMNTQEELDLAFEEFQQGRFIKHS